MADDIASLQFEPAVLEQLARQLLGLIHDLLPILVKDLGADFIKTSYVPVDGTKHSLITFEVDTVMFDQQLRAALRANGFNLPNRNDVIVSHALSSSA